MNLEVCLVATAPEVLVATDPEVLATEVLVTSALEVATVISVSTENLFFVFVIIIIISKCQQTKSKGARVSKFEARK